MAEEAAAKHWIWRELLRIACHDLPHSEIPVMASLGGGGVEPGLRSALDQSRRGSRIWFVERTFTRVEALKRSFPEARFYHGPTQRLREEFVRTNDLSLHVLHWDLTGQHQADVQPVAALLPFLWRSETRCLAVTVDDRFFCPPLADVATVLKITEGLFQECQVNWRILLDLYGEGGPGFTPSEGADPRWVALRELAALLCIIFAPLANAAVAVQGQGLAPLALLSRLAGRGSRPGWFMDNAKRSMAFLPGELTRYQVLAEDGTMLRTYVFRYVRQSNDVWESIRGWEWLFRAPLIRLTGEGPQQLHEMRTHFARPRPAAIEVKDLLPMEPELCSAPLLFDDGADGPHGSEPTASQDKEEGSPLAGPVLEEMALQQRERMEEVKKMAGSIPSKPPVKPVAAKAATPKPAAPVQAKKSAPAGKTEADNAYERLQPLKEVVSPPMWQNIETLYAEAKRERRPDHSESIAKLEAVIGELRAEQEDAGQPVPLPSAPAPAKARARKPKPKPKPAGQNGAGNGVELEHQVLHALKGKGKLRTEQLTKVLGMERSGMHLRRLLMRLRAEGKIKMEGQKRGTTYELVA